VNRWLGGLSDWQYVAVTASVCGLVGTVEGVLMVLVIGHLDLASLVLHWGVFTPMFCAVLVVEKRRRNRRARR
jgi:hypothetical protein